MDKRSNKKRDRSIERSTSNKRKNSNRQSQDIRKSFETLYSSNDIENMPIEVLIKRHPILNMYIKQDGYFEESDKLSLLDYQRKRRKQTLCSMGYTTGNIYISCDYYYLKVYDLNTDTSSDISSDTQSNIQVDYIRLFLQSLWQMCIDSKKEQCMFLNLFLSDNNTIKHYENIDSASKYETSFDQLNLLGRTNDWNIDTCIDLVKRSDFFIRFIQTISKVSLNKTSKKQSSKGLVQNAWLSIYDNQGIEGIITELSDYYTNITQQDGTNYPTAFYYRCTIANNQYYKFIWPYEFITTQERFTLLLYKYLKVFYREDQSIIEHSSVQSLIQLAEKVLISKPKCYYDPKTTNTMRLSKQLNKI